MPLESAPRRRPFAAFLVAAAAVALAPSVIVACVGENPSGASPTAPPAEAGAADSPTTTGDGAVPDTDAGGGEDAGEAGPPRFCATQSASVDVADFFCADFDGPTLEEGWAAKNLTDGGTLERTSALFASPPNSVVAAAPADPNLAYDVGGWLTWEKTGAKQIAETTLRFKVNVGTVGGSVGPTGGSVTLAMLRASTASVAIAYTNGGETVDVTDEYVGYYIEGNAFGGAAARVLWKLDAPPINQWVEVALVWTKDGYTKVTYNGIDKFAETTFDWSDTKVTVLLGAQGSGIVPIIAPHRFDDVLVSVKRP